MTAVPTKKPRKKAPSRRPVVTGQHSQPTETVPGKGSLKNVPSAIPRKKTPNPHAGTPSGGSGAPATPGALPYDPLAPLTPEQIAERARSGATAQVQPAYDAVASNERQQQAASATRGKELQGWNAYQQEQLNQAFKDTSTALNQMIAQSGASDQGSQDALSAALRSGSDSRAVEAARLGVAAPPSQDAALMAGSNAYQGANANFLRQNAANMIGMAGVNRERTAPTQYGEQSDAERRRLNAKLQEFAGQRTDIGGRLADLIAQGTTELGAAETQKAQEAAKLAESKAGRLFQQNLAGQELNLKGKELDNTINSTNATIRQNDAQIDLDTRKLISQSAIDWANVGINQDQVTAQIAETKRAARDAKTATSRENAKLRGEALTHGLEALSAYMAPDEITDPITGAKTKTFRNKNFNDALQSILQVPSMTKSDALRMLTHSQFESWRKRAQTSLTRMKRRGKKPAKKKTSSFKDKVLGN